MLSKGHGSRVIIGKLYKTLGYMLEAALESGFAASAYLQYC